MGGADGTASKMDQIPLWNTGGCFWRPPGQLKREDFVWYLKQLTWWWDGGSTAEQCASVTRGDNQGAESTVEERIFLSPFCPILAQSNISFARFAVVSREKFSLSFLVSYIADICITYMSYILLHHTLYTYIYIPILLGMEVHSQILFWHDMQD